MITYIYALQYGTKIAVTMAFSVLAISQIIHALNQHSHTVSIFSKNHPKNKYLYGAMIASLLVLMLIIFIEPLANFFYIHPLNFNQWLFVILISFTPLVVLESYKLLRKLIKRY